MAQPTSSDYIRRAVESALPTAKAEPQWATFGRRSLIAIGGLEAVILLIVSLAAGPRSFFSDFTWAAPPLAALPFVALCASVVRFGTYQGPIVRDIERRRSLSLGRPRDLPRLARSTEADRAGWYRMARRATLAYSVRRILLAVPACLLFAFGVLIAQPGDHTKGAGLAMVAIAITGALIWGAWMVLSSLWTVWFHQPVLLIGRATSQFRLASLKPNSYGGDISMQWLENGWFRSTDLEISGACRIARDGLLRADPTMRGQARRPIGRKLSQRILQDEHCVFLCAGDGALLYRIAELDRSD